jgi:ribosomal subunit interface protein
MNIIIKATNISLDGSVSRYIEKKLLPLEKFITDFLPQEKDLENPVEEKKQRIEFSIDVGKESAGSHKGFFFSKVRISIPGEKMVIAQSRANDLRKAIDELKDELYVQLASIKKKAMSVRERKARELKKETNLDKNSRFYRKGRIREEGL